MLLGRLSALWLAVVYVVRHEVFVCICQYTVAMEGVAGWLKSRPRQGGSRQRTSSRPMDAR